MGWESFDVVRFDLGPLLQGQTRTAKLKRDYNSFIIDPRGFQCETNLQDIVGWESSTILGDHQKCYKYLRTLCFCIFFFISESITAVLVPLFLLMNGTWYSTVGQYSLILLFLEFS